MRNQLIESAAVQELGERVAQRGIHRYHIFKLCTRQRLARASLMLQNVDRRFGWILVFLLAGTDALPQDIIVAVNYANPIGLDAPGNYSSADDLVSPGFGQAEDVLQRRRHDL